MIKLYKIVCQSSFISFTTCMTHPLLKLNCSVLLVMYKWLINGFYCEMNGKYSINLAVTHDALRH